MCFFSCFATASENGKCSYFKRTDKEEEKKLFTKYGLNAAHALHVPNTKLRVIIDSVEIKIKTNDEDPSVPNTILDLSEEAANALGLKHEGIFDCKVKILDEFDLVDFLLNTAPLCIVIILMLIIP